MELAEARRVPVRRISLVGEKPVPLWDFRQSVELIERGYQLAKEAMAAWPPRSQPLWGRGSKLENWLEGLIEAFK
jgi:hypothetical protein